MFSSIVSILDSDTQRTAVRDRQTPSTNQSEPARTDRVTQNEISPVSQNSARSDAAKLMALTRRMNEGCIEVEWVVPAKS